MPSRKPELGLTECRGSLTRRGPRTQLRGTFRKDAEGLEHWIAHCDRCDTRQAVVDHIMVRHTTEGVEYEPGRHVATRFDSDRTRRADRYTQDAFNFEEVEEEDSPF